MVPSSVYANNTYAPNTDFSSSYIKDLGVTAQNYLQKIDPNKPYYDPTQLYTGIGGLRYAQAFSPEKI